MSEHSEISKIRRMLQILAAAFGLFITFLLPLKFGALCGAPKITMIYWEELFSIIISPWPSAVFYVLAPCFLLLSVIASPPGRELVPALWIFLAVSAVLGAFPAGNEPAAAIYYIVHFFSAAAYIAGMSNVLRSVPKFAEYSVAALSVGLVFSLINGFDQYFNGFKDTLDSFEQVPEELKNTAFHNGIAMRLKESRVSAGFSACNAYAGYLVLALPAAVCAAWKLGSRIEPALPARILFSAPLLCGGFFILVKTGSRGALISLAAGIFAVLLFVKMKRMLKIALISLIPVAAAVFVFMIFAGRGAKSIMFRLDYLQGAFRMMCNSPLFGRGWGGFQRGFYLNKLIDDPEAPASPHNFLLTFGSQAGILSFLLACAVIAIPLVRAFRKFSGIKFSDAFSDRKIVNTGLLLGLSAWSIHSMQDILAETVPCITLAGLAGCLLAYSAPPAQECLKKRLPAILAQVALSAALLVMSAAVLRYDYALSKLNDLTDIHINKPEQVAKVDPSDVFARVERCDALMPGTCWQHLTCADFLMFRRDIYGAYAEFEKALMLDPFSPSLNYRFSMLLKAIPDMAERSEFYRARAEQFFPHEPAYRKKAE